MSLFGRRSAVPAATGYSVVDERLTISGEIHTDGTIRVDGRVEGTSHRADTLIVGSGGGIVGNIEARDVVVGGTIHGNVVASGRVELQASASVVGNIRAGSMVLQEGAVIRGHISIDAAPEQTSSSNEHRLELSAAHPAPAVSRG
jgi:cytoskeletal protein CcmA (bactofilin family)